MHNCYAQTIYYTDVSKCCESLTDWGIPLKNIICFSQLFPTLRLVKLRQRGDAIFDLVLGALGAWSAVTEPVINECFVDTVKAM